LAAAPRFGAAFAVVFAVVVRVVRVALAATFFAGAFIILADFVAAAVFVVLAARVVAAFLTGAFAVFAAGLRPGVARPVAVLRVARIASG
jgi:hypothetical protein